MEHWRGPETVWVGKDFWKGCLTIWGLTEQTNTNQIGYKYILVGFQIFELCRYFSLNEASHHTSLLFVRKAVLYMDVLSD